MDEVQERIDGSRWLVHLLGNRGHDARYSLDLTEIEKLLGTVVKDIKTAANRVRYAMNGFVNAVGSYVKPLSKQAKAAAKQIETISVDVGDTDCKIPLATAYIERIESAGRLGKKRKTIRC